MRIQDASSVILRAAGTYVLGLTAVILVFAIVVSIYGTFYKPSEITTPAPASSSPAIPNSPTVANNPATPAITGPVPDNVLFAHVLRYPLAHGFRQLPVLKPGMVYTTYYDTKEGTRLTDFALSLTEGFRISMPAHENHNFGGFGLAFSPVTEIEPLYFSGSSCSFQLDESTDSFTLSRHHNRSPGSGTLNFVFEKRSTPPATWVHLERKLGPDITAELVSLASETGQADVFDKRPTHLPIGLVPVSIGQYAPMLVAVDVQIRQADQAGQPYPDHFWRSLSISPYPPEVVLIRTDTKEVKRYPFGASHRVTIRENELPSGLYSAFVRPVAEARIRVSMRFNRNSKLKYIR